MSFTKRIRAALHCLFSPDRERMLEVDLMLAQEALAEARNRELAYTYARTLAEAQVQHRAMILQAWRGSLEPEPTPSPIIRRVHQFGPGSGANN